MLLLLALQILLILNRLVKKDGEYLKFLKQFIPGGKDLTDVKSLRDVLVYLKMLDDLQKEVGENFLSKINLIERLKVNALRTT